MSHKSYLGDAVYVELDDFGDIKLTTENGYEATNVIVMEPFVFKALVDWFETLRSLKQEARE